MRNNSGTVVHSPDVSTIGLIVQFNDTPRIAQYINIKQAFTIDVMTICEVEVFGARCRTGNYGDKCSSNCSQQCIADECHHVSGMCNLGCKPGYTFLIDPKCKTQCPGDTYGFMCHSSCSKKCKYGCKKVDGECNCCVDGWTGQFCDDKEEQKFTISEVAVVAGGSLGGCLLLLGLVFACVLGYRRYMSASKTKDTTCVVPDRIYANTGRGYEGPYEMPLKNSNEHIYQTIQN
ncbi:multiple epidermal growth factor-like domains protein 10 [Mya arenaria]|uniref:multiple epidermal growth factor-like domains protein 10 n=1 Tax=Mya arenaria TaxID=6604 RepID=UPI0022E7512A|nr:multiple epidermal growth factor-like domains protein 10 [Mya arenaria]